MRAKLLESSLMGNPVRIIVGAGGTSYLGWISTEIHHLNLLKPEDWAKYFRPNSIKAILAEHVWEHLTAEEGTAAANFCYQYLSPGAHIRVAVPDGLHPDPYYIDLVRPGGIGPGADQHKMLYNYQTLGNMFEAAGFEIKLLEYFDQKGDFHFTDWDRSDGMIERSTRYDTRNWKNRQAYTSLIMDAKK